MKRFLSMLCVITVLFSLAACGNHADDRQDESNKIEQISTEKSTDASDTESETQKSDGITNSDTTTDISANNKEENHMLKIEIIVGNKTFSGVLYDNAAAKALAERLPVTLNMKELNGNEKYYYLDESLPANSSRPSGIKAGDIMLYGNNCLVLFYESFSTVYSYTPLGHIDDPKGLAASLGGGSVQVTFQKG